MTPHGKLADAIADLSADALLKMKKEMSGRGVVMRRSHVRATVREVAAGLLAISGLGAATVAAPRRPARAKPAGFGGAGVIPPSPENVEAYSASIDYPLDGQRWCDQYAAKDWKIGSAPMKDWQAAVRNWKANRWGLGTVALEQTGTAGGAVRDYTKI